MSKADYMRQWRSGNTTARERQTKAARARAKALQVLAQVHHKEFLELLNKCRKDEGLPPL